MNRTVLLGYQCLIGVSDSSTGALLIVAPEFTLRLMHLQVPAATLPFVSFIGAFVLSVGLSCLYGAWVFASGGIVERVEMVWLLTALTRSSVAIFVSTQIVAGTLEIGWLTVALSDGACVVIQALGLRKGWLRNVSR